MNAYFGGSRYRVTTSAFAASGNYMSQPMTLECALDAMKWWKGTYARESFETTEAIQRQIRSAALQ